MELSYAAYNYPDGTPLPVIPGAFMGDVDYTSADILRSLGFASEDILEINYTPVTGIAAHTIGHREITIMNNSKTGDDNNDISSTILASVCNSSKDFSAITTSSGMDSEGVSEYTNGDSGDVCLTENISISNSARELVD